jgi:hypothetical protein
VALVIKHLLCKHKVLSSNPNPTTKKKKKKKRESNFTRHCHSIVDPCNGKDPILVSILREERVTGTGRKRD